MECVSTSVDEIGHELASVKLEEKFVDDLPVRLFKGVDLITAESILLFMYNLGAVMAGSFVARLFFPEWKPNDIDLFVPAGGDANDIQVRQVVGGLAQSMEWIEQTDVFRDTTENYVCEHCIGSMRFSTPARGFDTAMKHLSINVIFYFSKNQQQLIESIRQSFDFDGCAIIFDGKKIIMPPCTSDADFLAGKWIIRPHSVCPIIEQWPLAQLKWNAHVENMHPRFQLSLAKMRRTRVSRIKKYMARGITFPNAIDIILELLGAD